MSAMMQKLGVSAPSRCSPCARATAPTLAHPTHASFGSGAVRRQPSETLSKVEP